jgi:hypothetical protein
MAVWRWWWLCTAGCAEHVRKSGGRSGKIPGVPDLASSGPTRTTNAKDRGQTIGGLPAA